MKSIGVYVHFPWCLRKCPYCDFASFERERGAIDHRGYADAVVKELEARRALFHGRLESVFFGGGTPSLWEPEELGRVLEAILAGADAHADDGVEITVECNPSSLDPGRARGFAAVGVNRLSVGVQGLDRTRLDFLGRLHDPEQALTAVRAAIDAGVRVNADLMIGIATGFDEAAAQRPAEAVTEALAVADLGVSHISAYQLTVEPKTRFGELDRAGRLPLVGEDRMARTFLETSRALEERGYEHYEISNFARPGQRSRHNVGYWLGREYLGLGCAAYGTVSDARGTFRYRNAPNPERYLARIEAGAFEPHEREDLDGETLLRERLMLGLRLREGIDLEAAAAAVGTEPWSRDRRQAVKDLVAAGRLVQEGARLRIPREAWLFTDGTAAALF
ncbi:MAG: radical SAM family heme chaperone HemW [Deltaproteobacteria bacterium]|nr:radical SAM family heme chaperone HemW [Deltaproteobacteria bacterium]